jgi:hypothetical protein
MFYSCSKERELTIVIFIFYKLCCMLPPLKIVNLVDNALSKPWANNDEIFDLLREQLQEVEKRLDIMPISCSDENEVYKKKSSRFELREITNKEDLKRSQKLKRDHRRTRVIRSIPEVDPSLVNALQLNSEYNDEKSPIPFSNSPHYDNFVGETPDGDDKEKDPDWSKTPLRVKQNRKKVKLGMPIV